MNGQNGSMELLKKITEDLAMRAAARRRLASLQVVCRNGRFAKKVPTHFDTPLMDTRRNLAVADLLLERPVLRRDCTCRGYWHISTGIPNCSDLVRKRKAKGV